MTTERAATESELAGRPVTVMGLGLFGGGAATVRHLVRLGARVTVTDLRGEEELAPSLRELAEIPLRFVLGRHEPTDFSEAALVVANPAVPRSSSFLERARAARVPVTSEAALFLDATPARVVAITGTQGKSSACHYLAQFLRMRKGAGRVWLGGNIGNSLLDDLEQMRAGELCVLELSSYQLESLPDELRRPRAESAVELVGILNLLPDHLERHGSIEAYARAKWRILELVRAGGAALVPRELRERFGDHDPTHPRMLEPPRIEDASAELSSALENSPLAARFERANALFALEAARQMGIEFELSLPALATLAGLPHRLERLAPRGGRQVWDNGVSTTPDSTLSALRNLPPALTLICGGQPKSLPTEELFAEIARRARRVIVFGIAAAEWLPQLKQAGVETHASAGAVEATHLALALTEPGEALLFSPACASFDAWPNFRARALAFRAALEQQPAGRAETRRL